MKKYMTFDELLDFLNKKIDVTSAELTEYMTKKKIHPKTKISNIPRYEQEDSQRVFDHFASINSKKVQEEDALINQESPSAPLEETLDIREYTVPEMATLLDEDKGKIYRFLNQHSIKPSQQKKRTQYFSYEDTLKIISNFTEPKLTIGQTATNRGATGELASELTERTSELSHELSREPSELQRSLIGEVTEKLTVEITYLRRENELLRNELEQKNRQLSELTQRLEQAQYLHSKTQTITEKQQPIFKMPDIIEAEKIDTKEPEKRSLLGFLKK